MLEDQQLVPRLHTLTKDERFTMRDASFMNTARAEQNEGGQAHEELQYGSSQEIRSRGLTQLGNELLEEAGTVRNAGHLLAPPHSSDVVGGSAYSQPQSKIASGSKEQRTSHAEDIADLRSGDLRLIEKLHERIAKRIQKLKRTEPTTESAEWNEWKAQREAQLALRSQAKIKIEKLRVGQGEELPGREYVIITDEDRQDFHSRDNNRLVLLQDRLKKRIKGAKARTKRGQDVDQSLAQLYKLLAWKAGVNLLTAQPSVEVERRIPDAIMAASGLSPEEAAKRIRKMLAGAFIPAKSNLKSASGQQLPGALQRPTRRLTKTQLALRDSELCTTQDKVDFDSGNYETAYRAWSRVRARKEQAARMNPRKRDAFVARWSRKPTFRVEKPSRAVDVQQASTLAASATGYKAPIWLDRPSVKMNDKSTGPASPVNLLPSSPSGSESNWADFFANLNEGDLPPTPRVGSSSYKPLKSSTGEHSYVTSVAASSLASPPNREEVYEDFHIPFDWELD